MAQVSAAQMAPLLNKLIGIAEFDSKKDKITVVDDTSEADVTYVGVARRPAKGSDKVWFITKIDENASNSLFLNTNMTVLTSEPKVAWDDRLFIPYNAEVYNTFDTTFDTTFG
jgi:hypothetical protein